MAISADGNVTSVLRVKVIRNINSMEFEENVDRFLIEEGIRFVVESLQYSTGYNGCDIVHCVLIAYRHILAETVEKTDVKK